MSKVCKWCEPSNHKEVLQFLGLVEYLARFMPNVSAYSGPLQTICTSNLPFRWTPLHQKCFDSIKVLACKTPILKPINWDIPREVTKDERQKYHVWVVTDACPAGMGAILAQGESWQSARPAAFMSKKFTATQRSYFAYELEALGVLEALTKWCDKLSGGRRFTVVTDHQALTYFKEKKHTAGWHIRWQNFFYGFQCDILYVEGRKNKVADALSRYYESSTSDDLHYDDYVSADIQIDKHGEDLPLSRLEEAQEMLHFHCLQVESVRLSMARHKRESVLEHSPEHPVGRSKPTLADLMTEKNLGAIISSESFTNCVKEGYAKHAAWKGILDSPRSFPKFRVSEGMISKMNATGDYCLVIPNVIHKGERITGSVIQHAHEALGHSSFKKTLEYIRWYYWWSSMVKDVEKFIISCETCQTTKRRGLRKPGLLHQLPIPETPWSSISMDFVGPFPDSLGYNYLWVVVCRLTSQVHLVPVKTTTNALELAYEFLKEIVRLHGLPKSIVSDRDSKFTSKFWMELHRILGVRLKMTTAFHPEGDGQAERMIRNVVRIVRASVRPDQKDWVIHIPMVEFAINASVNRTTGYAPFELIYGYMPRMTIELPKTELPGVASFAQKALDNLQGAHDSIIKSQVEQLANTNKHRQPDSPKFKVGNLAYLSTKDISLPKGRARKLLLSFIGPYEILKAFKDSSNYKLKLPPELEKRGIYPKFHVSRLAPYEPNDSLLFPG